LKLEQTLEAAAVAAAAERAAESGDGDSNGINNSDETDHDFRKLRMPERMRLLTKNKEVLYTLNTLLYHTVLYVVRTIVN
jgi:hypothetical protein